jgi:hypothetical protein
MPILANPELVERRFESFQELELLYRQWVDAL